MTASTSAISAASSWGRAEEEGAADTREAQGT
jgi:hypothetical protein